MMLSRRSSLATQRRQPPSDAPRRSELERTAPLSHRMTDKHDLPGLRGLEVIAGFKFLQALTLILAGLGSFGLMNPGVSDAAGEWLTLPAPAATPGLVRSIFGTLGPALATGGVSV